MAGLKMNVEFPTRLCEVKGELGYFHLWEQWSNVVDASLLRGGHPAGQIGQVYGIVEFKDGVRRVDPVSIKFCDEENAALCALVKHNDYGDSFHTTFVEEGLAMARIRLGDKFSRFKTLSRLSCNDRDQQQVTDESIRDTLLDLANYAIMTVLEMDTPDESHATLYAYDKPIYTVKEDK